MAHRRLLFDLFHFTFDPIEFCFVNGHARNNHRLLSSVFFYDWIIGVNHIYAQSQVEMYHSNGPMARTKKRRPIKNLSSDHKFDYKIIYCSAKVNSPSFPSLPSPPHHTLTQIDSIYKRNRMHQIKLKINLQFVFQVFCTLALSPQQHTL